MKIVKILLAVILCATFTSCLSGEDSMTATRTLQSSSCFNFITNLDTGDGAINATGATYSLNIDYTKQIVDISVSGLQLTPGGASYSFNIPQIKYSFDASGAMVLNVGSYIDTSNNVSINNFKIKFLDRMLGSAWIPSWTISYEVDSRYRVRTVQYATYYFGESKVVVSDGAKSFETKEPYYCVSFDSKSLANGNKMKGKLFLHNAQFASSMPKMNMTIRDIEFVFDEYFIRANAPKLDLYLDDTTIRPDYAITNFVFNASYDQQVSGEIISHCCKVDFVCADRFDTSLELGYNVPVIEQQ